MAAHLLKAFISATGVDLTQYISNIDLSKIGMSDDEMSIFDFEEDGDLEPSSLQRKYASLQTYLDSVPYDCESLDEMQAKLEDIVGKIMICAHAKNWLLLTTWDGMLQWCALNHLIF
jgi:hypothetical protein